MGNEQFSFRAPPEEHGVTDCYHQVDEGEEGTFTKVGVVKRKIFVTQKLREEDRKRVKTATETHEKERLSHKYVAPLKRLASHSTRARSLAGTTPLFAPRANAR